MGDSAQRSGFGAQQTGDSAQRADSGLAATAEAEAEAATPAALGAAERGIAIHLAMQHMDIAECATAAGIETQLARLAETGVLTEGQREAVDARKIARFFESDIGKRLLEAAKAGNVRREFRFSLLVDAERYYQGGGYDDKILLQGSVDCFFEEGGEITVIDFKSDRVTAQTMRDRARHHAPQLEAYAEALERIVGKRVKRRVIYFFAADAAVEV
jgi:ATP-dependent helicase/nuclease subunit A